MLEAFPNMKIRNTKSTVEIREFLVNLKKDAASLFVFFPKSEYFTYFDNFMGIYGTFVSFLYQKNLRTNFIEKIVHIFSTTNHT